MSEFRYKSVCENVTFYSHHIAPIDAGTSGVLTLANGNTSIPQVADQTYTFEAKASADAENNHLLLTGQSGGPSPAVALLDINPNGNVVIPSGSLTAQTQLVVNCSPITDGQGSSAIALLTDNSGAQYYKWYASNGNGGGLADGHLQLFSYNDSSNWVSQVIDIAPQDASNYGATTSFFGNLRLPAQTYFADGNIAGPKSQQFPNISVTSVQLSLNATGTTVYAFNLPSSFAGKTNFTVIIDKFSATHTAGGGGTDNLTFYLSDTQNSPINPAESCLQYSTGQTGVAGTPFAVPSMTFVYSGSSSPAGLFLNVVSSLASSWSSQINNATFNASIIAH